MQQTDRVLQRSPVSAPFTQRGKASRNVILNKERFRNISRALATKREHKESFSPPAEGRGRKIVIQ